MKSTIGGIIAGTGTLVVLYLVLTNSFGAARLLGETGKVYVGAVKALQGR